jgi:hypothetical protein
MSVVLAVDTNVLVYAADADSQFIPRAATGSNGKGRDQRAILYDQAGKCWLRLVARSPDMECLSRAGTVGLF